MRWDLPPWLQERISGGSKAVGALAVDVEPIVFWNGRDAQERVEEWKRTVHWKSGLEDGSWGHARAASNGTSGQAVEEDVLKPLGISSEQTWFTDVVPYFFAKSASSSKKRGQADVIREIYNVVAPELGLEEADLPARPTPSQLIRTASADERPRLRAELTEASPRAVVALGEESRRVLASIADYLSGPPNQPLDGGPGPEYGVPGQVTVGAITAKWYALTHPGNHGDPKWRQAIEQWKEGVRASEG